MIGAKARAGPVGNPGVKRNTNDLDTGLAVGGFNIAKSGQQGIGGFTTITWNQCGLDRANVPAFFNAWNL